MNTLVLHRYNGDEIYEIDPSDISVVQHENGIDLSIFLQTNKTPIQTLQDTQNKRKTFCWLNLHI